MIHTTVGHTASVYSMLTAEYDGRCRAHDAEERAVNWILHGAHVVVRRHKIGSVNRTCCERV